MLIKVYTVDIYFSTSHFQINFRGITGSVGFDQSGFRSSITLDVMTIDSEGLQKVSVTV